MHGNYLFDERPPFRARLPGPPSEVLFWTVAGTAFVIGQDCWPGSRVWRVPHLFDLYIGHNSLVFRQFLERIGNCPCSVGHREPLSVTEADNRSAIATFLFDALPSRGPSDRHVDQNSQFHHPRTAHGIATRADGRDDNLHAMQPFPRQPRENQLQRRGYGAVRSVGVWVFSPFPPFTTAL
jgi:hypothetical protein